MSSESVNSKLESSPYLKRQFHSVSVAIIFNFFDDACRSGTFKSGACSAKFVFSEILCFKSEGEITEGPLLNPRRDIWFTLACFDIDNVNFCPATAIIGAYEVEKTITQCKISDIVSEAQSGRPATVVLHPAFDAEERIGYL